MRHGGSRKPERAINVATATLPRRSLLGGLGATLLGGRTKADARVDALHEAAAARGLVYGAQAYEFPPVFSPAFDRLVARHCALLAPKLNWTLVEPRAGQRVAQPDRGVVAFARAHGIALTGANPVWFERVPDWFRALPDRRTQERALTRHLADLGARYGRETWSINVVNEALLPADGRADGLRRSALTERLGPAHLDIAFHAARAAFPRSLLVYNEFGLEQEEGDLVAKRRALLGLLDRLRRDGTPIDAVGLQAHLSLGRSFDEEGFAGFLREVAARGLRILVTELDVLDVAAPADLERRDRAVAEMYRRFLDVTLAERAVAAVVTWGLSDRHTWLTARQSRRFARRDGLPGRPLPFDAEFRPKPACFAMLEAFRAAPDRRP